MARGNFALVIAPSMLLQLHYQRFLRLRFSNLLECRNRHTTTSRRCWSVLSNWHLSTPYALNASIDSPSARVTIAFFHSRASKGRGAEPLRRIIRCFPGMRMILTATTFTLKIVSTARRTSILFASNATLKVYWLCFSCNFTVFSVTIPWRSTSVISTALFLLALCWSWCFGCLRLLRLHVHSLLTCFLGAHAVTEDQFNPAHSPLWHN